MLSRTMALLTAASTLALFLAAAPGTAQEPPPNSTPQAEAVPAAASDAIDAFAGRVVGPIGQEGGLLAGERGMVTFDQLDDVLIWRDGKSPNGKAALRQLLELRVLASLAEKENVVITDDMLRKRFDELDAEARNGGVPGGLAEFIETQGVDPAEFREYLRLSMIHEELTRRALSLEAGKPVTADQQQLWLESTLRSRGYEEQPHPWADGVVCTSAEVTITRKEFAAHLRSNADPNDQAEAIYLILLERAVRARMPEVTNEGVSAALDREIERRNAQAAADPRYQGATYEQVLDARGLSIEAVRRDPAIRAAALAHEAVDRANDDEGLRAVYDAEREYYDGTYGESVEVRVLFRNAGEGNQLVESFEKVEKQLREIQGAIEGPQDFARVVEQFSEDRASRENGGFVGRLTRLTPAAPKELRDGVFAALDAASESAEKTSVEGAIIGPIRLKNGVVLALLSGRQPAPTWETMKDNVHRELRGKFLRETLPPSAVVTYLDVK